MSIVRRISACTTLLVVAAALCSIAQERSDYQIVQGFQSNYKAIQKAIEAAQGVEDCVSIKEAIDALEREYSSHKAMLDKALYPDGFDKRISNARTQLRLAQDKLGVIEAQVKRISELRAQAEFLTDQVEKLSGENTTLLKQVSQMAASRTKDTIDSLKNLVQRLQSNIRQRDQLIFALVDSLFMQYDKNMAGLKDVERQGLSNKIESSNVFTSIRKSIQDNLDFLESTSLTGRDIAELEKEEGKFESHWKGLGPKLSATYGSSKKGAREVTEIDTMLAGWKQKVGTLFWRELNLEFQNNGFAVKEFGSGQEFYTNLTSFIDEEIKNEKGEKDDLRYRRYLTFSDSLWTKDLKSVWLPVLLERGELTDSLNRELESKVDDWRKSVQPPRTWLNVSIAVILIVLLWSAYNRRKKIFPRAGQPSGVV